MNSPHTPLSAVEDYIPPQEELVNSVRMLQALRDPTCADHRRALASLDEHVTNPSFVLVMMHVFSSGAQYAQQGLTTDLRQLAGLIIKNYVFKHLTQLPANVQAMLKKEVVRVLHDAIPDIRKTAAILAGRISEAFPVATWSDMLPPILQMLSVELFPTHASVLEGGLEAMQRICEDSALKLALDDVNRPLDVLIPKLLALMGCSEASIRISALTSYNALLYLLNPDNFEDNSPRNKYTSSTKSNSSANSAVGNAAHPLIIHMNTFIAQLALLSTDTNTNVRTLVCQAITTISTTHVAVLDAYFTDICVFMLAALQDTQECVAIESCEYWAVMLETSDTKQAIEPYLPTLVQHLISRLYLTEEQMESERVNEEGEDSGEKELNLRPIHHRNTSNTGSSSAEDKENAELSAKWTLRKQAALLLDTVAVSFPPADVLSAALPRIQEYFQHANALVKECGMLALGALSTGCMDEMAPYLPQLFPFLLQNVQDPLPEMRSIACWVLSRYCCLYTDMNNSTTTSPTSAGAGSNSGSMYYTQTLQVLLNTMFDAKPKVQIAACSALGILIEQSFYVYSGGDSSNILLPHVHTILSHVSRGFDMYGVKASLVLVDTIGTLADTIGADLQGAQYTALYLPKLMHKFNSLDDLDMRMFPMLECLSSVLSAIGLDAQQYVLHVYTRCIRIITTVLKEHAEAGPVAVDGEEDELPHKDFVVCSLDVISALVEGLHDLFHSVVADTQTHTVLFNILFTVCTDVYPELRQSAFSLAGEVCKFCFSSLINVDIATTLVQHAIRNLHTDYPLVCNNAAWCIGELALHSGGDFMAPFVAQIMHKLILGLQTEELPENIKVNLAVTIGRLAMGDTLEVAELADEYFADWCSVLEMPCAPAERVHAYTGMLHVLHQNPQVLLNNKTHIYSFLVAMLAWPESPPEVILTGLRDICMAVKNNNASMFNKVLGKFGLHYDITALVNMYQLTL